MDLDLFCPRATRSVRTSVYRNLFLLLAVLSEITLLAGAQSSPVAIVGIPSQVNLDSVGIPNAPPSGNAPTDYFPDGHLSVLWDGKTNTSQVIWAEYQSWASFGADVRSSTMAYPILGVQPANGQWGDGPTASGDRSDPTSFYNSGSWLYSAFRVDQGTFNLNPNSNYMIGFFHGEDHWYTDQGTTNSYYHDPVSWRAIGLATSSDGGRTWTRKGMVVGVPTLKPRYPPPFSPSNPKPPFAGIGDHSAVLDNHSNLGQPSWVVFFPMIGSNGIDNGQGIGAVRTATPMPRPAVGTPITTVRLELHS